MLQQTRYPEQVLNIAQRLRGILRLLRFTPFDTTSPEGKSSERYRRIFLTTGTSFAARGVSVLTSLIVVPLCIGYLGREQYGIWMTVSSFFVMMGFTDLGIGHGLLNAVAEAHGRDDRGQIRKYLSNAFAFLLTIGCACLLIALIAYWFLPLHRIFNVSTADAIRECNQAVLVFASIFAVNLPALMVQRLEDGRQEGYIVQLFQIVGSVLSLVMVVICIQLRLGLPWLVLSFQGGLTGALLINCLYQFGHRTPWARPSLRLFDAATAKRLIKTGLMFFALNLWGAIGMQTDALVIANVINPSAVTPFAVVQRLSQVAFIYWASFQALWPAYGEAIARNDFDWVRRTIRRSTKISLACGLGIGIGILLFGQIIINLWMHREFPVPPSLLAGFGAFIFINSLAATLAVVMCTGILLKQQLILLSIAVPACFVLKIILCRHWGIAGPIWATAFAYGLLYVVPGYMVVHRRFALGSR